MKIGVLTSGGDAPGMNAAIRAVVRSGLHAADTLVGIKSGFTGLISGEIAPLDSFSVANIIQCGGTILKTSRSEEFKTAQGLQKAKAQLEKNQIEGLVIIGGDGSFRGALELSEVWGGQIIGIPGTIDNDVFGTHESIGFDTAINTALYAVDKIRDTADSHGRFFLIEVMGRLSGHIAVNVGLAGGADEVFVPEFNTDFEGLCETLCEYRDRNKRSSIIIVAEGNPMGHAHEIADRLYEKCGNPYRVVVLGHLLRGGSPSAKDRILASKLGDQAITALKDGKTNVMVGRLKEKLITVPFSDVIAGRKELSEYEKKLLGKLS